MSQPQPYFDTERDLPVDVEGRTPRPASCLLCGLEATTAEIWLKPAWWRAPGSDGKRITTIPRCLDVEACRARVLAAGEAWPLLERGEQPEDSERINRRYLADLERIYLGPTATEPAASAASDVEPPKEEDEWI